MTRANPRSVRPSVDTCAAKNGFHPRRSREDTSTPPVKKRGLFGWVGRVGQVRVVAQPFRAGEKRTCPTHGQRQSCEQALLSMFKIARVGAGSRTAPTLVHLSAA